jgi:hypothetical protein
METRRFLHLGGEDAEGQDARGGFQTLRQYVGRKPPQERCDLCATAVPKGHQHLLEPASRALLCACEACTILFSAPGAKYRRVPRRISLVTDFDAPDQLWEDLAIPINMVYFYLDSASDGAKASYPSPAGATESLLSLDAWEQLTAANPILTKMETDVEALLANRLKLPFGTGVPEYFLLPIDECFKLVGLIRTHWRGLSGGAVVWEELAQYFSSLRERAYTVQGAGRG